ncbi:Golgi-specific brefeldin A-resistance guanine nucleotide exchange factor 1 homolog isoform X2 [Bactrocera neohumeralis]|uniref:Golgi-specific brefeldin A-resistance guanine nucleotide exchange factor 1 homolog isoform X2 n=1 Tax=Bactrocera tryoni TaxID=59916 RepID=UPI001A9870E0|nr:Golgi-specific brefeldin A-resistance guanine nucleotide exchange factor 1 homolog isoform X2 [Bactrocera tryoni]XP_050333091.1 Golgi-specific brefeldin A-resistance guanine nucleotide exchange factor 1 homolog isoform X2 [Bactrocera neohumeralis]
MEVLSVQNQYQGQFGVIGSSKVKDWASPLTPPPPTTTQLPTGNHTTSDNVVHNQSNNSNNHSLSYKQQAIREEQQDEALQPALQLYAEDAIAGGDVVDGGNWSAPQQAHHKQAHHHEQRHFYYNNHHYGGAQHNNHHQYHQQHHHHQPHYNHLAHHDNNYQHYQAAQQQQGKYYSEGQKRATQAYQKQKTAPLPTNNKQAAMEATYNNNLFYYEPPVAAGITPTGSPTTGSCFGSATTDVDIAAVNELAQRVQTELRDAKKRHLDCTEVSLPFDLMPRIAAEIIKASEREPCGVRGCSLYIDFECEPSNVRRIASFKVDDCTVSTFELYLTLKQDKSGWTSLLPQFIKNLTRSNTILISPDFTLTKNKLYSCD